MKENYFIKEGYVCNEVKTYNQNEIDDNYWTEDRINASLIFQYHVYEYAAKMFEEKGLKSVVDVGSGPGIKTVNFFKNIADKVTLIDQPTTGNKIFKDQSNVQFFGLNLEKVSAEKVEEIGKHDMVICADVIEHLENPTVLLDFMKSIANKDTIIIISTPERNNRRGVDNMRSPNKEHVREWSLKEFSDYLKSEGFTVVDHITMPMKKTGVLAKKFGELFNKVKYNETQVIALKQNG